MTRSKPHKPETEIPFGPEPGWLGAFTRAQAAGAIPNGSRIIKAASETGDGTPEGTPGVVLGSISHPEILGGELLYFVEWANRPRCAVGVMAFKVRAAH